MQPEVRGSAGRGRVARCWDALHVSVQGASHVRHGTVCQDGSESGALDRGRWAYVVVADGHGSRPYFRSDRGARFAVDSLVEQFQRFHSYAGGEETTPSRAMDDWKADAPRGIVASWRAKVAEDLTRDPLSVPSQAAEHTGVRGFLQDLVDNHGWGTARRVLNDMEARAEGRYPAPEEPMPWEVRAYGTTLLGVLVGPDCLFWLQMGDGAMVQILGGEAGYLVPPPPEAMANQTPSLCDDDAVLRMRAGAVHLAAGGVPSTVVLSTDGIPNSYETEQGFFQFCHDIAQYVQDPADLRERLLRWLPEISRTGSGDDVSVAMAWASEEPAGRPPDAQPDEEAQDATTPPLGMPRIDGADDTPVAPHTDRGEPGRC